MCEKTSLLKSRQIFVLHLCIASFEWKMSFCFLQYQDLALLDMSRLVCIVHSYASKIWVVVLVSDAAAAAAAAESRWLLKSASVK